MPTKNNHIGLKVAIGVAIVGVAGFFLLRKKTTTPFYDTNRVPTGNSTGTTAPIDNTYIPTEPPNMITDMLTTLLNKLTSLPDNTLSTSPSTKVLAYGLTSDRDIKLLQQYLNKFSQTRKSQGQPYVAIISVDGAFGASTAAAMQLYMGKQSVTVGELNQRLAATIAGSVPIVIGF